MKDNLSAVLRDAKLKVTSTRLQVLEIFSLCLCKPVNAEYVHQKLKRGGVDLVTIYRTLGTFEKAGVIRKVDLRKESDYYELAKNHHHHIVCTSCGKTEQFEACDINKISSKILQKSPLFATASLHSFELFGTCKSCAKK